MAKKTSLQKQEAAMAGRAPVKKAPPPPPPPANNKPSGSDKKGSDKKGSDKKGSDKKGNDTAVVDTSAIDAANERIKELEDEIAAGKTEDEKDALRLQQERELLEAEKKEKAKSIYDTVTSELTRLGLSSLIDPLKRLFESGITDGESLRLALSQTQQYQTRFSANAKRIAAGLSALSPAEYIQLEDQYQNVMRNYGLPATYYAKDLTGKQIGFDELLGGDVSATELEERLIAGQERVLKSNPEVLKAITDFYGDSITDGNILAYALDPKNALKEIQRKVAAAEIGGAALAQKLATSAASAEALAGYGVTKLQAQQGFADVAQMAPRGSALSEIYNEAPYNQETATAEVFGTAGAAAATQKRKKLTALEQATFGGQSGLSQGALARNSGAGAF
jgi:hypothetical protein